HALLVADDIEGEAFGDLFEHTLGLFGFLEEIGNLRIGGDADLQLFAEEDRQLIDEGDLARIGEGDFERSVLRMYRDEVVPEHEIDGNGAEEIGIDARFLQVDEVAAIAAGKSLSMRLFLARVVK